MKKGMNVSKIMIVEDERLVALSIKEILILEGHEVCGVTNSASQALKEISSNLPDLVIMDIRIKGQVDGIEAAKAIKDKFGVPSIFLTAYSDDYLLERAKKAEPLGYILKPFKPDELISVVKVALYKSAKEKKRDLRSQELEYEVEKRTKKLSDEIIYRKQTEKKLQQKSDFLKQANRALKSLLETRDAEQRALEESMLLNIKKYVLPYVELIKSQTSEVKVLQALQLLEDALEKTVSPASKTLFGKYLNLTPQESKIADLIRQGKKTKEIANFMNLAPSSVSTHRYSIRKKFGLLNSNTNLEKYLNTCDSKP